MNPEMKAELQTAMDTLQDRMQDMRAFLKGDSLLTEVQALWAMREAARNLQWAINEISRVEQ